MGDEYTVNDDEGPVSFGLSPFLSTPVGSGSEEF